MALTLDSLKPIFPKFDYKYTERPKATCATYLSDRNPLNLPLASEYKMGTVRPPPSSDGQVSSNAIDWRGKSRGLFFHHPQGNVNVICVKLSEDCKRPLPVICRERTRTRCTQTRYRESSAQTRPYLPEIGNNNENYENYEIYQISKLLDSYEPPGEYEIKVVERARRRRKYENALKLSNHNKEKHRSVLEALEWEDWVAREEYIQGCQMLRMEIVERMFKNREKNLREMSAARISYSTERILAKRNSQLRKINIEYDRGMRRLEAKKQKISRSYRKGNIVQQHIDPSSDLHAPQMRFGVNPSRRHFVGFRRYFDDRIDELDKLPDNAALTCPFSKLKTWAKPKERIKEVTQRFCSDENLKNIYESLRGLRMKSQALKRNPKCLKKKTKTNPIEGIVTFEEVSDQDLEILSAERDEDYGETDNENECESNEKPTEDTNQGKSEDIFFKTKEEIASIVGEFEGTTLGKLLQFLSEELERVKVQKKYQAIQLLAKKERWRREACEAGLRQKENKQREQQDRLFAKVYGTRQDTSTLFLESVLEKEFNLSTEALAREKIDELAEEIQEVDEDEQDVELMMLQNKDKQAYDRQIISEFVKNQVFEVAEKRFAKMKAGKIQAAELRAIEEELYASVEKALASQFQTPDSILVVGEVLDELIDNSVTYDFDIFTPSSSESEFDTQKEVNDVINKLFQRATCKSVEGGDFFDSTDIDNKLTAEKEAKALIGKMIRKTIPEERWKAQSERIVEQTLSDTFNEAFYEIECLRASKQVRANDRLNEVISEIYQRMEEFRGGDRKRKSPEESSSSTFSGVLRSVPSHIDIFENSDGYPASEGSLRGIIYEEFQDQSMKTFNYAHRENLNQDEPVEVFRCHERFNLLDENVKPWKSSISVQMSGEGNEFSATLSTSTEENISLMSHQNELVASRVLSAPISRGLHPDLPVFGEDMDQVKMSGSYERESACFERVSAFQERPKCSCYKSNEDERRASC